jgi:transcription initiation factor TFIIB
MLYHNSERGIGEMKDNLECSECGCKHLIRDYERGELVCGDCGIVIDDLQIDQGPEWRAFDSAQAESRARTGAPMTQLLHDKGLSTVIDIKNKDSYGKSIPSKNRAQMYRLRKWQRRIRISNASERNLSTALTEINRIGSSLGLPKNILEAAAVIYRHAVEKNLIRGRSIDGMAAASIYASCRQCNVPRTLDEIAAVSTIHRKNLGRCYRYLTRELDIRLMPTSPVDYISRFCSELKLSGNTQNESIKILKQAENLDVLSGRGPTGMAAAAIYIASVVTTERRTQNEIANVAGVTEVTIRNRYKELVRKLGLTIEI